MVKRLDECIGYLGDHVGLPIFMHLVLILLSARLQGHRAVLDPISAMHDAKYDVDQELFCQCNRIPWSGSRKATG